VEYYASFIFTGTFTGTASSGFCNLLSFGNLKLEARVGIEPALALSATSPLHLLIAAVQEVAAIRTE